MPKKYGHVWNTKPVLRKRQGKKETVICDIRPYARAVMMQGTPTSYETCKQGSEQNLVGIIARKLSHSGPSQTVRAFPLHHGDPQCLAETLGSIRQFVQNVGGTIKRCVAVASLPRTEYESRIIAGCSHGVPDVGSWLCWRCRQAFTLMSQPQKPQRNYCTCSPRVHHVGCQ